MEFWQTLLVAFGGNLVLVAAVGYLAKVFVGALLAKDLERFKADLQRAAVEHQVRFSRLHETRAEVLAELYRRLAKAISDTHRFVASRNQGQGREALESLVALYSYLDERRIFLPTDLCGRLDDFTDTLRETAIRIDLFGNIPNPNPDTLKQAQEVYAAAWHSVEHHVPQLRHDLEEEFRTLLGDATVLGTRQPSVP